ncbi:hypothetical protein ACLEXA_17680 [Pseudescherichia vulneris]
MVQSIIPGSQKISSTKAPDIQRKENSNLVRSLTSAALSHETMSFPSSKKIKATPSTSEPDKDHIAATEGSIFDESCLEPKMTRYREYRCRGHNLGNAQSMLRVLKSRLSAESVNDSGYATQNISDLLPALEQLTGELLTLEALEGLTEEQRDVVNKREEVVWGLIQSFTLLLDCLPHKQAHINEKKREALREELVNSALSRLLNDQKNGEDRQTYEAEIRELIHASPHLMSIPLRERLESFYAAGLAKLNEPVKQELDKINHTLKSAYRFLSQSSRNAMPPGPHPFPLATTDFRHNVKKCAELLNAAMTRVEKNIQEISTSQKNTAKHGRGDRWRTQQAIRWSVSAKKIMTSAENTSRKVTHFLDPVELYEKSTRSVPRSQLISFDKATANTRELCLKLKEMSLPVQGLAVQLQRAARELENAITHAKSQGTKALPRVDTPEKAILAELQILTDDTSQTRLLQTMQAARDVTLRVQNSPTIPQLPPSAVSTDTEKVFRHFIQEFIGTLRSAASQLNETLQLAKNDLQQESVTDGLYRVIEMAGKMQNDLRYQLESSTAVSLGSSRELLHEQQNIFLRTLYPVTRITGKGHSQYPTLTHTAEQARINKAHFHEIHRSILPMLNQVEKVRVANGMLDMGLSASGKENDSEYKALNTAIQKCRSLQLNDIRKVGASAVQVSSMKDIAVYQRGDIGAVHSTTLGKVLKRLSGELLETAHRVQITAEGAAWSADENKKTLSLEVTKMTKRLETIKADIKDVVWAATGTRLHNNPPEGMIAKDAGEWLAVLRKEWDGKYTRQEINKETEKVIRYISKEFANEDDPEGQLFKTRIMLALGDAEGDGIPWPLTAEAHLGGTKANKAYIQAWAEKRLTYGMLYNLLIHGTTTAMLSVHKSSLVSPLRLLNLLLTPVRMEMTRRAMEKVRPGNSRPSATIAEYESREKFQAAVRLVSMLSPQLPKTIAAIGITTTGLLEGGEYRDKFLTRAVSRLPGDLFWVGGFAAWGAAVQAGQKYLINGKVPDDQITAEMLATLKKQLEDMQTTAGNEYVDEDEPVEFRSEYNIAELKALEVAYEADSTSSTIQKNVTTKNTRPNEEKSPDNERHKITKRELGTPPSSKWHNNIPATASIHSKHFDFNHGVHYQDFSDEKKKSSYVYAINFLLLQIINDERSTPEIENNARLAMYGAKNLVPVDMNGDILNNVLFLPNSPGSKSGVLISPGSEIPYYYINSGKDLPENLSYGLPYKANEKRYKVIERTFRLLTIDIPRGIDVINGVRAGRLNFETNFNSKNPESMDIQHIAATLASTIEADYKLKGQTILNSSLIPRAIAGAHIPSSGITVTEQKQLLEYTWEHLTSAEYLKSFSRPFSTLSGEMQLISSSTKGETILETNQHIHKAEYIGSWVDATVGLITSLTPVGWGLNTAQAAAGIAADMAEGKTPDPLAIAGLVVGCIPGGRIAAKVGKFTRIGGNVVKYGLMLGGKAVDLAILGNSIKTAVDTGDPLAIYQAFLASGMSLSHSYEMTKTLSSKLNLRNRIEDITSLEELEAVHNNSPDYTLTPTIPAQKFRVGSTEMLGKINNGELKISTDNGVTWQSGTQLHLLTYRLQNAGGRRLFGRNITIGEHAFKRINYNSSKFDQVMKIANTYNQASGVSERIAEIQTQYRRGKEISSEHQYDHYNDLPLDDLLDLYINNDSDIVMRGVLSGKINKVIKNINLYDAALAADTWRRAANKAKDIVLVPQNIFLRGMPGKCLPEAVLMGWALQTGQDGKLIKNLMDIYYSPIVDNNVLYKSLSALHTEGNSSKFSKETITGLNVKMLDQVESKLFPAGISAVRVDFIGHTVLLSKVNEGGKLKYTFYDPNYGLSYFNNYKDMMAFFIKQSMKDYNLDIAVSFHHLDYSNVQDVKIKGMNLSEIIDSEIPSLYKQENINLDEYAFNNGVYSHGDKSYIKVNDSVYQVEKDLTTNTWRVFDPSDTNSPKKTIQVKQDSDGVWFKHMDTPEKNLLALPPSSLPPVSKATKELEDFVRSAKDHPDANYEGPYVPVEGDFKKDAGKSIYINRKGVKYIYINNEYFIFRYTGQYNGRQGIITIGNKNYLIYLRNWKWSTHRL